MQKNHLIRIGVLVVSLTAIPYTVSAQQNAATPNLPHLQANDLRQYPSIIQISGEALGGAPNTKFVLRCGYAMDGSKMVLDPTTNDLSIVNEGAHAYARYQYIDGKPFIGTVDPSRPSGPAGVAQVIFQVTEPDNSVKAKSCSLNLETDTPQSCMPAQPFASPEQSLAAVEALAKQCSDFMTQASSQIQPGVFDVQKTQDWKAKLHQTLVLIEQ